MSMTFQIRDIGLVYSGYLMGAVFSLITCCKRAKGKLNLLLITFVYVISIGTLFSVPFLFSLWALPFFVLRCLLFMPVLLRL